MRRTPQRRILPSLGERQESTGVSKVLVGLSGHVGCPQGWLQCQHPWGRVGSTFQVFDDFLNRWVPLVEPEVFVPLCRKCVWGAISWSHGCGG